MPTRKAQDLPQTGKILCLDVGEKTLGIAVCDALRTIASPRTTIRRTKWGQDKQALGTLITTENITCIVVGLPLMMDGSQGASADRSLNFAKLVEDELGLPVLLWDERLSTAAAERSLFEQRTGRQTRASKKDIKEHLDSVAAALILQSVLDALRG
ncbi:MAG: Holliday junction resolvase RuvX [Proteobacteria bacterium]|nr:Holliday junction resolvase RuvX [Pseudomonadota bacterium]